MIDVTSLTIPEGTVKKIEDSNGNMIWGSASAYPYRRLEYIENADRTVKGSACIRLTNNTTGEKIGNILSGGGDNSSWSNTQTQIKTRRVEIDYQLTTTEFASAGSIGEYDKQWYGALAAFKDNANWKLGYAIPESGGIYRCVGSNTSGVRNVDIKSYAWNTNRQYLRMSSKGNIYVGDTSRGYMNASGSSINPGYMSIFCQKYDASEWSILAKVYGVKIWDVEASSPYHVVQIGNCVPAQRKSDGVCGLYDTIDKVFYPNVGSKPLVAGPVISEYWDTNS